MSDKATLVNRLRGIYTIPVIDGAGLLNESNTFTKKFDGLPPINEEAAKRIVELESYKEGVAKALETLADRLLDGDELLVGDNGGLVLESWMCVGNACVDTMLELLMNLNGDGTADPSRARDAGDEAEGWAVDEAQARACASGCGDEDDDEEEEE